MLNIITNNPYRISGVCSNSPQRDVVSNRNKMDAFLKVGREVSFPMDLNKLLPSPQRSLESVNKAQSDLTLPKDKVKYALFWFIKLTSLDDVAINNLTDGDSEKAIQIWLKRETMSSLLNLAMIAFIEEDYGKAINNITTIIHDDNYRQELINAVAGQTLSISEDELAQLFIDTLFECNPEEDWRHIFINIGKSADDDEYIASKLINPLIEKINLAINEAKQTKGKGSAARYNAGMALINKSGNFIKELNDLLDKDDLKYQNTVDKLAGEIFQCSVDYYNDSGKKEIDIRNAIKLATYAKSIASSNLIKERIDDGLKILREKEEEIKYTDDVKNISETLKNFANSSKSISNTRDFLNSSKSLLEILKAKIDANNTLFMQISSAIVNAALNAIIDILNKKEISKNSAISAMDVILLMKTFCMDRQTKERVEKNERILSANIASMPSDNTNNGCLSELFEILLCYAVYPMVYLTGIAFIIFIIGSIISGICSLFE